MRNELAVTAMCLALPVGMLAQAGAAAASAQSGSPAPGITATLTKGVDVKKAKVGDPVMAKTTGDFKLGNGTKVPNGSKLSGHVTEAQPHADGQASRLAVVFDSLEPKGGQPIATQLQVAGVSNAVSMSSGDMDSGMSAPPPGGGGGASSGSSSGGASSAPSMPSQSMPSPGTSGMTSQAAAPTTGSTIKDVTLGGDAVLTSSKKDINLQGGTVLTLTMAQTQQPQSPGGE